MILLRSVYLSIRQLVRHAVNRHSGLDRLIGDPLRKLERVLRPYDYLLQQTDESQINIHGLQLQYRKNDDGVIQIIQLTGEYEPETTAFVRSHLKPGGTFVDLGAHIGYLTLVAAQKVGPAGKVYAFEPNQDTFEQLRKNVALNHFSDRVQLVPKAIADCSRIARFSASPESSVSARIFEQDELADNIVEVETTSLDEFTAGLGWPAVDVIKMDVEGAEIPALVGMRQLSERNPQLVLIIEINYPHMERAQLSGEIFIQHFLDLGFRRFRILKSGYDEPLVMPQQLGFLLATAKRMTINLLCEK